MGLTIFRYNKEIARGVQSLWLSCGVLANLSMKNCLLQCLKTCWVKMEACVSLQTISIKPPWGSKNGCVNRW